MPQAIPWCSVAPAVCCGQALQRAAPTRVWCRIRWGILSAGARSGRSAGFAVFTYNRAWVVKVHTNAEDLPGRRRTHYSPQCCNKVRIGGISMGIGEGALVGTG